MGKVAVANEFPNDAVALDNGIDVVMSHHRLFTCSRTNIMEVLGMPWRPTRSTSLPASYRNCVYLTNEEAKLDVFTVGGYGALAKTVTLQRGALFWNAHRAR